MHAIMILGIGLISGGLLFVAGYLVGLWSGGCKDDPKYNEAYDSFMASSDWIKNNKHKFTGEWVALQDGVLLGHGFNRSRLQEEVDKISSDNVIFAKMDSDDG